MIRKHFRSYIYAGRGLWLAFRFEPNMRVHSFAAILVLVANIMLNVSRTDWVLTIIIISITFSAEVLNTAIEKLADRVSLEQDPLIGKAKDLAAGAVLIISVGAAICGAIIYLPYLFSL